jgi:hypothetical protein
MLLFGVARCSQGLTELRNPRHVGKVIARLVDVTCRQRDKEQIQTCT